MDIANSLMNQIRMQNAPQAQLIEQANQEADRLQNMPAPNPLGPAMMKFGLGIMGAPPEMSTSQAVGVAGQEAMKTYEEHAQRANQNRMQSIALRQTAANTIDAVKKFNMEMELKERHLRNEEAQISELSRHNRATEDNSVLQRLADARNKNIDRFKGQWEENAKQYSENQEKRNELRNAAEQLSQGVSPAATNDRLSTGNKLQKTTFNSSAIQQAQQAIAQEMINGNILAIQNAVRPYLEHDPSGFTQATEIGHRMRPILTDLYKSGADPKMIMKISTEGFSKGAPVERVMQTLKSYFEGKNHGK